MSVFEQLTQDMKTAMKSGEKDRLATIRLLRGYLKDEAINTQKELTPERELEILSKAAKQRKESIEAYQTAGRQDLVEQEEKELAVIQSYLPQPLSEKEIEEIVVSAIAEVGAESMKDIGKVMPVVIKQVKGRADGKAINTMVRQKLGQ